jgi:UDP-N-acetylmuramate: L-alanyl-gamma-D-glutamyl-meso-diaminopimelate ligase
MRHGGDRIHVLGICGTFMGGLAVLARELGWQVTGADRNVYPPMSTLLEREGIAITEGFDAAQLEPAPDLVVVGNAMTRGIPAVEHMLSRQLPYTSGPQWLGEQLLRQRHVLAVAGTHGKTTTASMLALILEHAGLAPGFLIGGVPANFGVSARLGNSRYFVIEADEYDTAFFDKRSKFVHYHPRTLVLNNLEFDHADIFPDLSAIERQFHHVVRIVPAEGRVVVNNASAALQRVLARGCWSELTSFAWHQAPADAASGTGGAVAPAAVRPGAADGHADDVGAADMAVGRGRWQVGVAPDGGYLIRCDDRAVGRLPPTIRGRHNAENAVAALAAAEHVGIEAQTAIRALADFRGVARRLEQVVSVGQVVVYDDFAHHPTAIARTLETVDAELRAQGMRCDRRLLAVLEPRSNTMRLGVHREALADALALADECWVYAPPAVAWDPEAVLGGRVQRLQVFSEIDTLAAQLAAAVQPGDTVLLMSNGAFGGLRQRLASLLNERFAGA